ncbi:MAG TPA: hypothetical protein VGT98_15810 [Candidatus Elarobacter sp.]|nr:hypothetical protein [Candidatus Elarobacter sp.]
MAVTDRTREQELDRQVALSGDADSDEIRGEHRAEHRAERAYSLDDDRDFENSDAPGSDWTTRLYIGLWLPAAGSILTYAVLRGNYWAAFIGAELLLVGWFTLGKL